MELIDVFAVVIGVGMLWVIASVLLNRDVAMNGVLERLQRTRGGYLERSPLRRSQMLRLSSPGQRYVLRIAASRAGRVMLISDTASPADLSLHIHSRKVSPDKAVARRCSGPMQTIGDPRFDECFVLNTNRIDLSHRIMNPRLRYLLGAVSAISELDVLWNGSGCSVTADPPPRAPFEWDALVDFTLGLLDQQDLADVAAAQAVSEKDVEAVSASARKAIAGMEDGV